MSCSLLEIYQCFRGTTCPHLLERDQVWLYLKMGMFQTNSRDINMILTDKFAALTLYPNCMCYEQIKQEPANTQIQYLPSNNTI